MSLLLEAMEPCVMLDKVSRSDGRGGVIYTWTEGAEFRAAVTYDTSMEARIGETLGVKSLYTITTTKAVNLRYHDVFKLLSNGDIFRVTSDGDYNKTPESAGLDMRVVQAEEWVLTGDDDNG